MIKKSRNNLSYIIKLLIIFIMVIIFRVLFIFLFESFYDYISYIYAIGLLLFILFPNLEEVNFFGIKAKGVIDDTNKMIFVENKNSGVNKYDR